MPPRRKPAPPPGFLPDAWFRAKKKELREILAAKVSKPEAVAYIIRDRLIPFFHKFAKEFNDIVTAPWARESVADRVEIAVAHLSKVADSIADIDYLVPLATEGDALLDQFRWMIGSAIEDAFEERVQKVSDALKFGWSVNMVALGALAADLEGSAPADVVKAMNDKNTLDTGSYRVKYEWLNSVKFTARAQKLLTRGKAATASLLLPKWVDRMYSILYYNYSEHALKVPFSQFDLYGMKVVIDDATVTPDDRQAYLRVLDEAYTRLKAKRLESAWHGTLFIQEQGAGGVNPNGAGFGVGAHYEIDKDIIVVFSRPSDKVVDLMVHEVGHRLWFKSLSQEQRGRFKSFITGLRGSEGLQSMTPNDVRNAKEDVKTAIQSMRSPMRWLTLATGFFRDIIKSSKDDISSAAWTFMRVIDAAMGVVWYAGPTEETTALKNVAREAARAARIKADNFDEEISAVIHAEPEPAEAPKDRDAYWLEVFRRALGPWLADMDKLLDAAHEAADTYIDAAAKEFNTREAARWKEQHSREDVEPVSTYGKSNIDEAFAEVFSHYVMGYDMTQPQMESFRAVLRSASFRAVLSPRKGQSEGTLDSPADHVKHQVARLLRAARLLTLGVGSS